MQIWKPLQKWQRLGVLDIRERNKKWGKTCLDNYLNFNACLYSSYHASTPFHLQFHQCTVFQKLLNEFTRCCFFQWCASSELIRLHPVTLHYHLRTSQYFCLKNKSKNSLMFYYLRIESWLRHQKPNQATNNKNHKNLTITFFIHSSLTPKSNAFLSSLLKFSYSDLLTFANSQIAHFEQSFGAFLDNIQQKAIEYLLCWPNHLLQLL